MTLSSRMFMGQRNFPHTRKVSQKIIARQSAQGE
jgi:hypothetical protein